MALREPKRNSRCLLCQRKGQCSCRRRLNAEAAKKPEAQPYTCAAMCGWNGKGRSCGRTVRQGQYCPCPNC